MKWNDIGVTKAEMRQVFLLFCGGMLAVFFSYHLKKGDLLVIGYSEWCKGIVISVGMGLVSVLLMIVNVRFLKRQPKSDGDDGRR
jgi:hypothetical protein